MSPEHRQIPEPGELVYRPRSSWAPAVFALALALALCSIFISFMLPNWVYAIAGILVALFALRSMVKDATRSYYRLPRKQHVRGAVLPVETISPPRS
ncbi:MAG TPA: hypothetical protein VN752_07955 [Solirubrobacterales bacterium]|nr:hypothetical protein [Solirubrobacterales bacterium]